MFRNLGNYNQAAINYPNQPYYPVAQHVKNVVVFIVDGMGVSYTSGLRYLKNNPYTKMMEPTAFDPFLKGMQTTYSWDEEQTVTDSAAAATSMATGVKTYNGAIGVDIYKNRVKTVLEQAKEYGKSTGLVVTSQINHATPAAFAAHNESRKNYDDIANAYFDDRINGQHKVDVMLGGGTDYFIRHDRNLVNEFRNDGYGYVTDRQSLIKDNNHRLLGLFAPVGLPKMIDRPKSVPSLADMTVAALNRLNQNPNGFFLLVEGSQVDWAGHDNDIVAAMSDMLDAEAAFKKVMQFAQMNPQTLVVVTADHATGGLSLGQGSEYIWNPNPIQAAKRTPDFMAEKIATGADVRDVLNKYIGFELTQTEISSVQAAATIGDQAEIDKAIEQIFNIRSNTGWTTSGHTGEDVPVYAYGPYADLYRGMIDNTDIAKVIFNVMR